MKQVLLFLFVVISVQAFAADVPLSLEDATKIAKQRAKVDNLPYDHLVVRLVNWLKDIPPFYVVNFDPKIPDPSSKEENAFIGFHIEMDGTIRRSVITVKTTYYKGPTRSEVGPFVLAMPISGLLDKPFKLQLASGEQDARADH